FRTLAERKKRLVLAEEQEKRRLALAEEQERRLLLEDQRRREEAEEQDRRAEQQEVDAYRERNPVEVRSHPEASLASSALRAFDWFLAESKFLLPPFARSYDQEAVEPKTWAMTPDDLRVRLPTSISSVYEVIDKEHKLPFHHASRRAPDEPLFRIPKWRVELVWTDGGLPVDLGSDRLSRIYATD